MPNTSAVERDARAASTAPAPFLCALLAAVVLSFAGIASHHLWSPDEPRDAAVGSEMAASGDFVVPRLNGQPFLEKPPLYWWVEAGAYRLLGTSDAVARLPSALFGTATLLVAYALGRRLGGPRVGLLSLAVLATTAEYSEDMGRAVVDPALVFFVALAHLGWVLIAAPRSPREGRWGCLLVALALPLAFLAKGVVGVGLGAGPPVFYLLASRRGRSFRLFLPLAVLALPLFVVAVAPWTLALYQHGGLAAVRECLIGNTFGRLLGTPAGAAYGHRRPFWYYLETGPAILLPWVLALPAAWKAGLWRRAENGAEKARRLLFATFALGLLLLSAAATKRGLYVVPLLPAFAACVAWWLAGTEEQGKDPGEGRTWDGPTLFVLLGLAAALPLLLGIAALGIRWGWLPGASTGMLRAALSPGGLAACGLAAFAGGAIVLARLLQDLRHGGRPAIAAIVLLYLMLFLALQTGFKALLDPVKNLHGLTAAVARLDPGSGPVAVYVPPHTSPE